MKIYWDNVSDVDHAILFPLGQMVGNSYIAAFTAEGTNNNEEAVILDFSTGKKQFKAVCDNIVDHKLWVNDRYHEVEYTDDSIVVRARGLDKQITFETMLPKDAVYVQSFESDVVMPFQHQKDYIEQAVRLANEDLSMKASTSEMKVTVRTNNDIFNNIKNKYFFRYTHGLPTSTSYGCQNICHGHLSYIELIPKDGVQEYIATRYRGKSELNKLFDRLGLRVYNQSVAMTPNYTYYGQHMANIHFICPTANVTDFEKKPDSLEYTIKTNTRGYMLNKIKFEEHNRFYNYVELDTLSTIENLGAFFKREMERHCPNLLEYFDVKISEGLSKGVFL